MGQWLNSYTLFKILLISFTVCVYKSIFNNNAYIDNYIDLKYKYKRDIYFIIT